MLFVGALMRMFLGECRCVRACLLLRVYVRVRVCVRTLATNMLQAVVVVFFSTLLFCIKR